MSEANKAKADAQRAEGNRHFMEERFDEAIRRYNEAMALDPDNAKLYTNRSLCYIKLKQWDEAASDARTAIRLDKSSVKAHYYLGQGLIALGNDEEAGDVLKLATDLAVQQRLDYGDEIWSLCRKVKQRVWDKKESQRILQEISLSEYLRKLVLKDKEEQLASNPRNAAKITEQFEDKLSQVTDLFKQIDERRRRRMVPDYLVGKISCDLLVDPVITPSGITYERYCIEEHLRANGGYDPVTRAKLKESQLVPNLALKDATEDFLRLNPWAYDW
ncbi:hypothetical protein CAOG_02783 [Capsaspora owczarzaki ATCC 30864]|nr:hypothetical protein CAOG_02783 [Capsaspora owczarzaki ATCC 30864]|eukprot:XP_004349536.1 hypothetical protein CAOG_02783 [Capsaspora owczarzaki ATCC 30864]